MNWRKGPPPSIGWWPASFSKNPNYLRWWNGKWWSQSVPSWVSAQTAARIAKNQTNLHDAIEWTNRPAWWPERSKT